MYRWVINFPRRVQILFVGSLYSDPLCRGIIIQHKKSVESWSARWIKIPKVKLKWGQNSILHLKAYKEVNNWTLVYEFIHYCGISIYYSEIFLKMTINAEFYVYPFSSVQRILTDFIKTQFHPALPYSYTHTVNVVIFARGNFAKTLARHFTWR